jgi:hypothetical protein
MRVSVRRDGLAWVYAAAMAVCACAEAVSKPQTKTWQKDPVQDLDQTQKNPFPSPTPSRRYLQNLQHCPTSLAQVWNIQTQACLQTTAVLTQHYRTRANSLLGGRSAVTGQVEVAVPLVSTA